MANITCWVASKNCLGAQEESQNQIWAANSGAPGAARKEGCVISGTWPPQLPAYRIENPWKEIMFCLMAGLIAFHLWCHITLITGLLGGAVSGFQVKTLECGKERSCDLSHMKSKSWVQTLSLISFIEYFWSRKWPPTPAFLSGKFHGQRSLVGYSPWVVRVRHDWATERNSSWVLIMQANSVLIIEWVSMSNYSMYLFRLFHLLILIYLFNYSNHPSNPLNRYYYQCLTDGKAKGAK